MCNLTNPRIGQSIVLAPVAPLLDKNFNYTFTRHLNLTFAVVPFLVSNLKWITSFSALHFFYIFTKMHVFHAIPNPLSVTVTYIGNKEWNEYIPLSKINTNSLSLILRKLQQKGYYIKITFCCLTNCLAQRIKCS